EHDEGSSNDFKVYKLFVHDTARLSDRRQTMNNIYLSVNSVLLGTLAILAQQSKLESLVLLVVEVFVGAAGILIAGQWLQLINKYRKLFQVRYALLRKLEDSSTFSASVKVYQEESKEPRTYGFSDIERHLPRIFLALYALGLPLLIVGTAILNRAQI